jgi:eukaryotic-like serine/threonine-protein kinase
MGPPSPPSRDVIAEIITSCFYHADTLQVQSIAFPLLGTGTGGFPVDICLDTMFRSLVRTFLRGLTSVRNARIVLHG